MNVKIKKLHVDAVIPKKAHPTDAGFELTAVSVEKKNDVDISKTRTSVKPSFRPPHPPEMFTRKGKEEWEESQRKWKEEWKTKREKEEISTDLSREKPEEFKKGRKNFIRTPDGKELEYDFETKTSDKVVTYFKGDKKIYSYLGESFISLLKYKKIFII